MFGFDYLLSEAPGVVGPRYKWPIPSVLLE